MRDFVEFRGEMVIAGWPEQVQAAQSVLSVTVNGLELPRVRYGDEREDWGADAHACHDCRVVKGEFHVPGCDAEECPACHGSMFSCDCEKE